jgi:hypothetical protein
MHGGGVQYQNDIHLKAQFFETGSNAYQEASAVF